jgi:hypothetical protein
LTIDGLSREQFTNAIENRRMPFLQSLIENKVCKTHSRYSGLPSSTPAVQEELFYGIRSAVPAFQFVDHCTGEHRVMFDQFTASHTEERLAAQGVGLLKGGRE